jgi:DNA-binding FadR family transcriptional regulator
MVAVPHKEPAMSRPCPTEAEITARIEVTRVELREHIRDVERIAVETVDPGRRLRLFIMRDEARDALKAIGERSVS